MVLIQLLLPTRVSDGDGALRRRRIADTMAALADTRQELTDTFDGLTAYLRSPATGLWTSPDGHREQDDVVMVEVVADRFDQTWWRRYVALLAKRFGQDEIHVRALGIQMLDEG